MIRRVRVNARVLIVAARFLLAMIASTITAGLVQFAWMWFLLRNWDQPNDPIQAARSVGAGVAILAMFISELAVGLILLIGVLRPLTLRMVLGLGAILGNLPFAFVMLTVVVVQLWRGNISTEIGQFWYGWSGAIRDIAMGTVSGITSSVVFWVIGIWRTGLEHGQLNTLLERTGPAAVEAARPLADTFPDGTQAARHLQ